jgi:orotate phosphoribosyltransferase
MLLRQLAEAVLRGPVTLPSGQTAEHYFDEYRVMASPEALAACVGAMVPLIAAAGRIDGIAGIVSAGLPFATLLSQRLRLPLSVVRSAPRPYGTATAVEGGPVTGRRLMLVDSVLSTGITSINAARLLRQCGAQVDTLAVMLDRERGGGAALAAEGLAVLPLVTWSQLLGGTAD